MNDFQMNFLASERRSSLASEADRQRVARSARRTAQRRDRRPRTRQLGLSLFLGRRILS